MFEPRFIYIAGPMRGLPQFNFPAFDAARIKLTNPETFVFSPAFRDRSAGFDPSEMTGHEDLADLGFDLREALAADTKWICEAATTMYMLDGWEESSGAKAEHALAQALGLEIWYQSDTTYCWLPVCEEEHAHSEETWLGTAEDIIHGARNEEYGHPYDDFEVIGSYWTTFLGDRLNGEISRIDVAAMMIQLKMARLSHNIDHVDSWVDIAGYVGCADRVQRRAKGLE